MRNWWVKSLSAEKKAACEVVNRIYHLCENGFFVDNIHHQSRKRKGTLPIERQALCIIIHHRISRVYLQIEIHFPNSRRS